MEFPDDFFHKPDTNKLTEGLAKAVRDQKDNDINKAAEKTTTPIVEVIKHLDNTVKEFDKSSTQLSQKMIETTEEFKDTTIVLSLKMTKTIERFEASSSKLTRIMIILTGVIAILTVVMIFK